MSKPHDAMKNIDRRQAFKMMVWLVAYYDFFFPKVMEEPPYLIKDIFSQRGKEGWLSCLNSFDVFIGMQLGL